MSIEIVPYRPELAPDFSRLNREWIERLFTLEAADLKVLNEPERAIIQPGGMIYFAVDGDVVLGTCAALRLDGQRYELAKMAVSDEAQGRGVGQLLGEATIRFAAEQGGSSMELLTNSSLANAIRLYVRLGFRHSPVPADNPYARGDVFMTRPLP